MMSSQTDQFVFEEVEGWARFPEGWEHGEIPGVAVDSQDRGYAFCRAPDPVVIFERDGRFVGSWGKGMFVRPHMIKIGADDAVYCVDDEGHRVRKFTLDGQPLMTINALNGPADTGYVPPDFYSVQRAGPPFNYPTDVAVLDDGDLYISDGYGNARIHLFDAEGRFQSSWGSPGDGPSQFRVPHGLFVDDRNLLYVCDRHNMRVQIFSLSGALMGQWDEVLWPNSICQDEAGHYFVAEIGGIWMQGQEAALDQPAARISVRDREGNILAQWHDQDPHGSGRYFAPHAVAMDSHGDLYVGEVTISYSKGQAPAGAKVLRKYARCR